MLYLLSLPHSEAPLIEGTSGKGSEADGSREEKDKVARTSFTATIVGRDASGFLRRNGHKREGEVRRWPQEVSAETRQTPEKRGRGAQKWAHNSAHTDTRTHSLHSI